MQLPASCVFSKSTIPGSARPTASCPSSPAAVIYDLGVGDPRVRPDKAMGYRACKAATEGPVSYRPGRRRNRRHGGQGSGPVRRRRRYRLGLRQAAQRRSRGCPRRRKFRRQRRRSRHRKDRGRRPRRDSPGRFVDVTPSLRHGHAPRVAGNQHHHRRHRHRRGPVIQWKRTW